ncbi:hypothetical protein [Sphingomonas corticis]|jgi:hypothetical protein|uniref:MarR family transcriptional regulator n=1 Tax=Sphingomonas corticis TaxID=2722791 RepID=A0ABX1CQZ9_9SPHN|nr:hypothetical protein [Sphingomonas corticis]NJR80369.1 hypothetical protein [Sphingomonas corticis]
MSADDDALAVARWLMRAHRRRSPSWLARTMRIPHHRAEALLARLEGDDRI